MGFQGRFRSVGFFVGLIISLICLYFAFRSIQWNLLLEEILSVPLWILFTALVCTISNGLLLARRWQILLKPLGPVRFADAFWNLRISYFLNASLPARLGEAFRIYHLKHFFQISVARSLGAMAADRLIDFLTLVLLVYLSAMVLGTRGYFPHTSWVLIAVIIVFVFIFLLSKLPQNSSRTWLHQLLQFRVRIYEGLRILKNFKTLRRTFLLTLGAWWFQISMILILTLGVGESLDPFKAVLVVGAVSLAVAVPSGPAHLGTFELAAIASLGLFGLSPEAAAAVAILYHAVQLVPSLLLGGYGYYFHFLRKAKPLTE